MCMCRGLCRWAPSRGVTIATNRHVVVVALSMSQHLRWDVQRANRHPLHRSHYPTSGHDGALHAQPPAPVTASLNFWRYSHTLRLQYPNIYSFSATQFPRHWPAVWCDCSPHPLLWCTVREESRVGCHANWVLARTRELAIADQSRH